jgi:hypothetical protein
LLDALSSPDILPQRIETMIRVYQRHRVGAQESFRAFVGRCEIGELQQLFALALGRP